MITTGTDREHSTQTALPKGNRLASLDGLRAISISLVLVGHLSGTHGVGTLDFGLGDYAHLGVVVFFVISGFLITSLLLSEHARKGRVSLKLFYARRSLRIFPASYVYLGAILCLFFAGFIHVEPRDLWHAVTYTVNYAPSCSWQVGHLWSLAVEEQFYLLWPFVFVVLGPPRALWAAGSMILLAPIARMAAWVLLVGTPYRNLPMFPMVADSLAMGCILAGLRGWLERQHWYLRLFRPIYSIALLIVVLLVNGYGRETVVILFGSSIINVCTMILIHRSVYYPGDRVGRALNWKPIAFVGVLSYSLYL